MRTSQIKQLSADGDLTTVTTYLRAVILTGGSDAATLVVKAGGSGGTTVLTLKAATGTTAASGDLHDALFPDGVYADFTGTGPVATFVYE